MAEGLVSADEPDVEIAAERVGEPLQGCDAEAGAAGFGLGYRWLCAPELVGQLLLGQSRALAGPAQQRAGLDCLQGWSACTGHKPELIRRDTPYLRWKHHDNCGQRNDADMRDPSNSTLVRLAAGTYGFWQQAESFSITRQLLLTTPLPGICEVRIRIQVRRCGQGVPALARKIGHLDALVYRVVVEARRTGRPV